MTREQNLETTEAVGAAGVTVAAAKQLAAGLLEIAELAMPDTYLADDSRCQLAHTVASAPGTIEDTATALIAGLDGTYNKTWPEVASQLRGAAADGVPAELDAAAVADLLGALDAAGLLP